MRWPVVSTLWAEEESGMVGIWRPKERRGGLKSPEYQDRERTSISQEAWLEGRKAAPLIKFLNAVHKSTCTLIKWLFNL